MSEVEFKKNKLVQDEPSSEELKRFKDELCKELPKVNIAAAVMPAIWGPANGSFITILFYPLWVFVDDLIYSAYITQTPFAIILAAISVVVIIVVSLFYGATAQKSAYIRALTKGKTKEQWLASQRIWSVAMIILAIIAVVLATYFNIVIKPTMDF